MANANTASNVSAGKPKVAGAIWVAPKGTSLPTDTAASLDAAFKCLGYCSEDGLTNSTNMESEQIKAWGGDTVLSIQTSKEDTYQFTLLEVLNTDVLKFIYGDSNVSETSGTSSTSAISVTANNAELPERSLVIDMIMRNNTPKRVVIPAAKISEIGDVVYSDSEAVGYEVTLQCIPDESGNTHYEYILKS